MAAFAEAEIARRTDLHQVAEFPRDIWAAMAGRGLLGIGIADGGQGEAKDGDSGGWQEISAAARALARAGGNLGMAMSWATHVVVSRLVIGGFGDARQRALLLPRLARGEITPCVAISEPGAGAHPKRLETRAEPADGGFALTGAKTYLTNGPIADLFVVLAITGEAAGRKQFSAFLVTRDNPGLALTATLPIDFLRPSPHCGIRLEGCRVPASAMLGPEGSAFEDIGMAMRSTEDVTSLGALTGALEHQIALLASLAAAVPAASPTEDFAAALGALAALPAGLGAIAERGAAALDAGRPAAELDQLSAAFRAMLRQTQEVFAAARGKSGIAEVPALDLATRDIVKTLGIAATAHRLRDAKRGRALLAEYAEQ